jgi:hypothetical protein
VRTRELRAHVDHAGVEVDVAPGQPEQLGDPHPCVERGDDERPPTWRAGREQPSDLIAAEHPLAAALTMGTLAGLELRDRVIHDPAVAQGVAQDAVQSRERSLCSPRRASACDELAQEIGDIFDSDRGDPTVREPRGKVALEVIAVLLERALVTLAGLDLLSESREPPPRDGSKPKLRRDRHLAAPAALDEPRPHCAGLVEIYPDSPEARLAAGHEADCVVAVGLQVDAALNARAP